MGTFKKVVDLVDSATKWVAIGAFSLMTVMVVLQIIFRYVLGAALSFSEELARFMFIWSVLLGSAICLKRRSHVCVEILMAYMPNVIKKYGGLIANVLGMAFYIILIIYGFQVVGITMRQTSAALGTKMGYVYLSIPVTGLIMLVDSIYNTIEDFMSFKKAAAVNSGSEVKKA